MKRVALWLTALLLVLFAVTPCAAADGFWCEYTPKTEKSAVFWIDIGSSSDISAAVMELSFDETIAEYRDVSAFSDSSSVRSSVEKGRVTIAFADIGSVKEKLCRVAFKAIRTGKGIFTLHISQAADGDHKMLSGFSDTSVEVTFGKDDIAADAASGGSTRSAKNGSGSLSELKEAEENEDQDDPQAAGVFDLRKSGEWTFMLIGAAVVLLMAALVFAGVLIGRKTADKKKRSAQYDNTFLPEDKNDKEDPT